MHFITDLGKPDHCRDQAAGNYVQIYANVTGLPLNVPLSFCLPASCNEMQPFHDLTAALTE